MSKKAEKQLRIATSFLVSAPAGEFDIVASDLESLSGSKPLVQTASHRAFLDWNHARCGIVTVGGNNVIICDEAKVADGAYINPYTQTIVRFDQAAQKFVPTQERVPGSTPGRAQLQQMLIDYVKIAYKSNMAVGVYDKAALFIVIRSSSISLKNFRTGNIIARYKYETSGKLTGTIAVMQHYFETGNVMCSQAARLEAAVAPGDLAQVIEKIREFENQWLKSYLDAFDWLANEGMTKLRRKIPISGTKISWEAEFRGLAGMQVPE